MSLLPFGRGFSIHRQWARPFLGVRGASRGGGGISPRGPRINGAGACGHPSGQTGGWKRWPERPIRARGARRRASTQWTNLPVLLSGRSFVGPLRGPLRMKGPSRDLAWTMKDRCAAMGGRGAKPFGQERPPVPLPARRFPIRTGKIGISGEHAVQPAAPEAGGVEAEAAGAPTRNRRDRRRRRRRQEPSITCWRSRAATPPHPLG